MTFRGAPHTDPNRDVVAELVAAVAAGRVRAVDVDALIGFVVLERAGLQASRATRYRRVAELRELLATRPGDASAAAAPAGVG